MREHFEVLEKNYRRAIQIVEGQRPDTIPDEIKRSVDPLLNKIESDKSLIQVVITTLLKKKISPQQDIRLHMSKFENGYSARGLDTKITTAFFKEYFPKYANKETAFLTKATRSEIIWDFTEGKRLPLRSKGLIDPFLNLIDKIQKEAINLDLCMVYIFANMYILSKNSQMIFDKVAEASNFYSVININTIIEMLKEHFESRLSSRLPVIAIYSIYQQLFNTSKRYEGKILRPLNVHTSSDKHGYGDIEIWNANGAPFEMVEIKHKIPIDRGLIFDVTKKSENTTIERYYILTTYENSFENAREEKYINNLILKIKQENDLEIIANGIINSLKYYLRFVEDYHEFLRTYTDELIIDAKNSTEVKDFHIEEWQRILEEHSGV
jgi:DNA (cytosine-5)-methyltransferase 1